MKAASNRQLLNQTDTVDNMTARSSQMVYSPYGFGKPGPLESLLGFAGVLYDAATKAYSLGNGHRVYSPLLMRFYQPDRLSPFHEGGLNSYVYCQGDPINFTDPTGRFKMPRRTMAQAKTSNSLQSSFRVTQGFNTERPRRVLQRAEQRHQQPAQRPQGRPQRVQQNHRQAPQPPQAAEMNLAQPVQAMGRAEMQIPAIGHQDARTHNVHLVEVVLGVMTLAMTAGSTAEAFAAWMTTGVVRNPIDTTHAMASYSPGYSLPRPPVG